MPKIRGKTLSVLNCATIDSQKQYFLVCLPSPKEIDLCALCTGGWDQYFQGSENEPGDIVVKALESSALIVLKCMS